MDCSKKLSSTSFLLYLLIFFWSCAFLLSFVLHFNDLWPSHLWRVQKQIKYILSTNMLTKYTHLLIKVEIKLRKTFTEHSKKNKKNFKYLHSWHLKEKLKLKLCKLSTLCFWNPKKCFQVFKLQNVLWHECHVKNALNYQLASIWMIHRLITGWADWWYGNGLHFIGCGITHLISWIITK